jgi:DNA-binding NtrC family response regulator
MGARTCLARHGPREGNHGEMELLVRIQQMPLRIPVVVISGGGYASTDDVLDMAKNSGAAATLDKPFTPRQLRETVERVLE